MELIYLVIVVLVIWCVWSVVYVKTGKADSFATAMVLVVVEVIHYCNTGEPKTVVVSYPYIMDEHAWLDFEDWIKKYFLNIEFATYEVGNGVVGGEFLVILVNASDINRLKHMLEKALRNFMLKQMNLHAQSVFSIYVHLEGHTLRFFYAISDEGLKYVEQQKANLRSRQQKKM